MSLGEAFQREYTVLPVVHCPSPQRDKTPPSSHLLLSQPSYVRLTHGTETGLCIAPSSFSAFIVCTYISALCVEIGGGGGAEGHPQGEIADGSGTLSDAAPQESD